MAPESRHGTCRSILIVEDDLDIREALESFLRSEGYEVHSCKNGKEALEKVKVIPSPALIFLDLMMPVMNGWDFLEAQKKDAVIATLPVVVVSALDEKKAEGAAGYLKKPIGLDALLATVTLFCGEPGA